MGLKDIGKITANATKRDNLRESVAALPEPQTAGGRQFSEQASKLSRTIKPRTSTPDNVAGHRGFKIDMKNPFHKDLLNHLYDNGTVGDLTFHEGGAVSLPSGVAYSAENAKKFEVAADTAGGKKRYEGIPTQPSTAVTPAPRKSEKTAGPSVRPAAPRPTKPVSPVKSVANNIGSDPKSEIAALFVGAGTRVSPESVALEKQKKADAEAADKAERLRLRKERLAED
jgi:hypothetical protein